MALLLSHSGFAHRKRRFSDPSIMAFFCIYADGLRSVSRRGSNVAYIGGWTEEGCESCFVELSGFGKSNLRVNALTLRTYREWGPCGKACTASKSCHSCWRFAVYVFTICDNCSYSLNYVGGTSIELVQGTSRPRGTCIQIAIDNAGGDI